MMFDRLMSSLSVRSDFPTPICEARRDTCPLLSPIYLTMIYGHTWISTSCLFPFYLSYGRVGCLLPSFPHPLTSFVDMHSAVEESGARMELLAPNTRALLMQYISPPQTHDMGLRNGSSDEDTIGLPGRELGRWEINLDISGSYRSGTLGSVRGRVPT